MFVHIYGRWKRAHNLGSLKKTILSKLNGVRPGNAYDCGGVIMDSQAKWEPDVFHV